ncbi:MAG TPA: SPOR domain-containing protein [Gaiellaceae bacterium]|nr:SPOR domain-containing protein [Gaiellaceae bacterium]
MTADVVPYRSRRRREAEDRAAKDKRAKIVLVAGLVVLALLGAIEGPKTLKKLRGTKAPAAAPASSPAATPAASASAAPSASAADLHRISGFAAKDPFVAQVGATPSAGHLQPAGVTPPAVRANHFVPKDPFVAQLSADSVTPVPSSPSSPSAPAPSVSGNYIVVLASVPVSDGRAAASRAASEARARGVASVRIVDSSKYPTLRTGFYAVYSGPYATLADVQPVLEQIRGEGYPSAYTRRLAR